MGRLRKEDWESVDRLFDEVLALPESKRRDFLESSTATAEVVERVARLLVAHEKAESRIGESAESLADHLVQGLDDVETEAYPPGSQIGPYRVVGTIGQGGMGTVYRAERADEQYERDVAIKVVKRGTDTDEVLARFRRERGILARLQHPRIARMYDAGATTDGRPYLVLEYVEGPTIDAYCDQNRLAVEDRIRVFLQVCDAVSYAHQQLVLHRDLKPSNVLVSQEGVCLLDFGIAKLLDTGDATTALTQVAGRRLTPDYASPEQLLGDSVSTASDIYSLGVLLYELLTGARPGLETSTATGGGTVRRPSTAVSVQEVADRDPSQIAGLRGSTPDRLSRRMQGDIDVILLKALHEEPERRYSSVEAFAADLRAHLTGFPVRARPDSLTYRASKFVRRNRLPVLSGSGVALATVVFAIGTAVQQAQTARERDRAEQERERAEEVSAVLEDFFTGAGFGSRDRIDTLTVRAFLDRTAEQVLSDTESQPSVQGSLLRILGAAQTEFGAIDEADTLLSRAVSVLEGSGLPGERALRLAHRDLGHLRVSQGRFEEAKSLYGSWLESGSALSDLDRAQAHHHLSIALLNLGNMAEAAKSSDSALAIHRANPTLGRAEHAAIASLRAALAMRMQENELASSLGLESWEIAQEVFGVDHPNTLGIGQNYALILMRTGRVTEAERLFASLVERYGREVGTTTPNYGVLLLNHGNALRESGRLRESLSVLTQAHSVQVAVLGPSNPNLLQTFDGLAKTLLELDRPAEALEWLADQLGIAEQTVGLEHPAALSAIQGIEAALRDLEDNGGPEAAIARAKNLLSRPT